MAVWDWERIGKIRVRFSVCLFVFLPTGWQQWDM